MNKIIIRVGLLMMFCFLVVLTSCTALMMPASSTSTQSELVPTSNKAVKTEGLPNKPASTGDKKK